jgi:hypothetical protein
MPGSASRYFMVRIFLFLSLKSPGRARLILRTLLPEMPFGDANRLLVHNFFSCVTLCRPPDNPHTPPLFRPSSGARKLAKSPFLWGSTKVPLGEPGDLVFAVSGQSTTKRGFRLPLERGSSVRPNAPFLPGHTRQTAINRRQSGCISQTFDVSEVKTTASYGAIAKKLCSPSCGAWQPRDRQDMLQNRDLQVLISSGETRKGRAGKRKIEPGTGWGTQEHVQRRRKPRREWEPMRHG